MAQKKYGKWQVIESLPKEGGQGFVYIVVDSTDPKSPKRILKRIKNINRLARLKQEIEAGIRLRHKNIINVIDYELETNKPYIVTEFCAGGDLTEYGALPTLSTLDKLHLFAEICDGASHAHKNTPVIIHRDLKPNNIFLNEKRIPIIGDFGICFIDNGERITITEEAVGPRLFMAPELEDGRAGDISPAADVYSLGKLLYWIMTGEVFAREKHRERKYNLVDKYHDPSLEHINQLLDKTISSLPAQRYSSAVELYSATMEAIKMIQENYNVVGKDLAQRCIYCGKGTYMVVARSGNASLTNFGLNPHGAPSMFVRACNHCGNVQIFDLTATKDPDIWGKLR